MGNVIPKIHFILVASLLFSFVTPSFSATKNSKKQAQTYRNQGYAAQRAGNLDMALSYYQRAIGIDSDYAVAYNDIGVVLEAKGESGRAKQAYSRAISSDPKLLSAYYNLAALYEKERNFDKAAYYWGMRIHLGEWSDVWTWRAKESLDALKESGKIEGVSIPMEGAVGLSAVSDLKRDAQYHLYQGRQYVAAGDYVAALKELNAASVLDPGNYGIEQLLEETGRRVLLYK